MSYIIRLEEPCHGKESLGGLCGPKMFPLQKKVRVRYVRIKCSTVQGKSSFRDWVLYNCDLVEKVNDLGEDVETSSWIDWSFIEDTSLWTREETFE